MEGRLVESYAKSASAGGGMNMSTDLEWLKKMADEEDKCVVDIPALEALLAEVRRQRNEAQAGVERLKGNAWPAMAATLQAQRDEAVAHRDDYENKCIEQSIEIRRLRAEVKRLDRERGQACYDRDAARSVVAAWEERALAAEAEAEQQSQRRQDVIKALREMKKQRDEAETGLEYLSGCIRYFLEHVRQYPEEQEAALRLLEDGLAQS